MSLSRRCQTINIFTDFSSNVCSLDASLARYCTSYDSHTYVHWNPAFTATPNSSKFYWFPVKCLQFSCVCVRNWTLFSFTIGISLSRQRKMIHSFTELQLNVCSLDAFWLDIGLYSDISWSIGIPHSRLCQTIHSPKSYMIFRDMFVVSDEFGSDIGLHSHIYIYVYIQWNPTFTAVLNSPQFTDFPSNVCTLDAFGWDNGLHSHISFGIPLLRLC